MIDLVAKRYVKALILGKDSNSLNNLYTQLKNIIPAYGDNKFLAIITSSDVKVNDKVEFILSLIENVNGDITNLIKLLGEKKRLDILPEIVSHLEKELAVLNNSYTGIVYTNKELNSADMDKLNSQFANKFNVNLELSQNVCDYDGIKVDIDGLGVEVGFAKSRLKSQMIDHILKAV